MTGISMITSDGKLGKNVMAAEWTMQISYDPMLIAVFVHESAATFKNIRETKEFGVNVASDKQTSLVNIAGGYSKTEIDKLDIKNSFNLIKSNHIKPPMIDGCIVNAECKLVTMKKLGDHTMIVGKVVSIKHDATKKPLIYHTGRYYQIGTMIEPFRQILKVNDKTFEWFSSESGEKFVLKCVGAIIRSGKKIVVSSRSSDKNAYETIPYVIPNRGTDYYDAIITYLKKSGLNITLKQKPILKRIIIKNKKKFQRINFVLFEGRLRSNTHVKLKNVKSDIILESIVN